jgi:hypothetical protein
MEQILLRLPIFFMISTLHAVSFLRRCGRLFAAAIWDRKVQTCCWSTIVSACAPFITRSMAGFPFCLGSEGDFDRSHFPHCLDEAAVADLFNFSFVMGEKRFRGHQAASCLVFHRYRDGHWRFHAIGT